MSDEQQKVKKKGRGRKLLLVGLLVLAVGGGGAGAVYAGLLGGGHGHDKGSGKPHLVPREGVSAAEVARNASPDGDKKVDPARFQPTYHAMGESITANLRDGSGFVQVALGVSTYYDSSVLDKVKLHEMAIRSAILLALSDQDAEALATPAGKQGLKDELRGAINGVLKSKEGFGGIDEVHFTGFVIQ